MDALPVAPAAAAAQSSPPDSLPSHYACTPETEGVLCALVELLSSAAPEAGPAVQARWLEALCGWLQAPGAVPARVGRLVPVEAAGRARLRLLVEVLAQVPAWREAVAGVVSALLANTSAVRLFSDTGLSGGRGLLGDAARRLAQRVVPAAPDERDLGALLFRLFPGRRGAAWLEEVGEEQVAALCALLEPEQGPSPFAPLGMAVADAAAVLAARAGALGLAGDVLERLPPGPLAQRSPFLALPRACEALRLAVEEGAGGAALARAQGACAQAIAGCRAVAQAVLDDMHAHAVDTDLVYRLEQLGLTLERLESLLWLLAPEHAEARARSAPRMLARLVQAHERERNVSALFRQSVRYVSRRVFEHTGELGRHYISTSPDTYHRLVHAAAGGGMLTAGTAALKLAIAFAALPLFFEGLAASANYALSFMLLQLFGFTLATKQPSMTGAALAASLDVRAGDKDMRGLVGHLTHIARSQAASVFGNLSVVMIVAVAVSLLWQWVAGEPMLSVAQAEYAVHALHPLESGTLPFAALTGVLLWTASVCGGMLENWAHYHRLGEALARHRGLILLLGEARARRLGERLAHNACGLGANVSLGLLLGMTPALGRFFGLPLDVRHVTLSAGTLAFAGASLGPYRVLEPDFLWALAGLGCVGAVNLGVSFYLGLTAAVRSRGLAPVGLLPLARALLAGGLRSLLPPRPLLPASPPRSPNGVRSAARSRPPWLQ